MKKFLSAFLVLVLLFTCVACGKTDSANTDSTNTTESTTENKTESTTNHTTDGETTTEYVSESESTTLVEESTTKAQSEEETTKKNNTTTTKKNETTTKKQETTTKKTETTTKKPSANTTTTTTKPTSTTTTTKPTNSTVSVVTSSDITKIKSGFLRLVNEERTRVGVGTLKSHSALNSYANTRSREILNTFSHTRPNGEPFYSIIKPNEYAYYNIGENIQYTSHMGSHSFTKADLFVGRDDQIVAAYTIMFNNFKNSPGHYANMINSNFTETGVGISYRIDENTGMAVFYICQIFGRSAD